MMFECIDKIYPSVSIDTVTGSICNFTDNIGGLPLKSCTSLISGYQEGSGTPSPDNVRPLHAFSSASLGKCDNNTASLWNIDNSFNGDVEFNQLASLSGVNTMTSSNVTFTKNNDNSYTISGTANGRVLTSNVVIDRFYTVTGHKYLFDISESITPLRLREQNNSLPFISGSTVVNCSEGKNAYFTFDSTVDISGTSFNVSNLYINIFDLTQMFPSTIADYIYNLEQTEAGVGVAFFKSLYPNSYYPYNTGTKQLVGDTLATFTFGQSIYQGYIDWKRGVVVGTHKVITYDGSSDEIWCRYTIGSASAFAMYSDNSLGSNVDTIPNSNYLMGLSRFETWGNYDKWVSISVVDKLITGIMSITDVEVWKTYLSNNPLTVVYELATPIEIPLGGINLLTQQGVNNIFADCGDTTVEYIKIV